MLRGGGGGGVGGGVVRVTESVRPDWESVRRGGQLLPAGATLENKSLSNTKSKFFPI